MRSWCSFFWICCLRHWSPHLVCVNNFPVAKCLSVVISGWCWCMQTRSMVPKTLGRGCSEAGFLLGFACIFLLPPLLTLPCAGVQAHLYLAQFGRERGESDKIGQCSYPRHDSGNYHLPGLRSHAGVSGVGTLIIHHWWSNQLCFTLSSSSVFCWSDTVTDSKRFYKSVLDFLDNPEKEEVGDLLNWWNQ